MADVNSIRARLAGVQHRELEFERASLDTDRRTIEVAFCSEEPYERWWGVEILDCQAGSVRLERLRNQAAVLVNHDADQHVGVVEAARMSKDRVGRATLRFGRGELADAILRDVHDDIRTKVSVGYRIHDLVLERKEADLSTYRVTDWEPFEISIVSVPADDTVGVGRGITPKGNYMQRSNFPTREERRSASNERELLLARAPDEDREAFRQYLDELENEYGKPFTGNIAAEYSRFRADTIKTIAASWPEYPEIGALAVTIQGDSTLSVAAFRKKVLTMLQERRGTPTVTGTLELDRLTPTHQRPYGEGAREIQRFNLQAFKGPDAESRAHACGQWFRSQLGDKSAARWCVENGIVARVMTEGVFTTGGALAPDLVANEIISNVENYGAYRRYARNWPMTSAALDVPTSGQGLSIAAVSETTATPTSDLATTRTTLTPKEFAGGTRVSRSLIEDSAIALGDFLVMEFGRALAKIEDQCGFTADGTSTYGGMRGLIWKLENDASVAGSKQAATSGHDTFAEFDVSDLTAVMGLIPEYARAGAAWYLSGTAKDTILTRLAANAGGNTTQTIREGVGESFLGYPVRLVQVMPAGSGTNYNAKVVALFGNLALAAAFGDRRAMEAVVDLSRFIEFRQVYFQVAERFDVNNHLNGATATVCGPIAGLLGTT